MNRLPLRQKGASAVVTIIFLAVLGYAVYIGIQYVPQAIESRAIDSILNTVDTGHKTDRISTENDAMTRVVKLLQINEMNDMTENVSVKKANGNLVITLRYDRELNLVYKKHPMHYEKSLILR